VETNGSRYHQDCFWSISYCFGATEMPFDQAEQVPLRTLRDTLDSFVLAFTNSLPHN